MPTFSVIIPTYNRAMSLKEALRSVLAQELRDFEVIVVDDGSTDETPAVLNSFGKSVRFFRQENKGAGAARNVGIQHSLGDYVAFLDSDDLWFPWTLETYAQVVREANEPAFIAGKPKRFTDNQRVFDVADDEPLASTEFNDYYASGDEWRWWGASSFVARRDTLESVGGFTSDWVNGEDADLAMRLGIASGFAQITAPVTFAYREHNDSATHDLPRTVRGARVMLAAEKTGRYPGGLARACDRRRILTRHIRPITLECLRQGLRTDAWGLYRETFEWHLRLGRWKYLLGFPIKAMVSR